MTEAALNNILLYFTQGDDRAGAAWAGEVLLVQETLDQAKESAGAAWVYNPGHAPRTNARRTSPSTNPGTNSDKPAHLRSAGHLQNGSPERYGLEAGREERRSTYPTNAYHPAERDAQVRRSAAQETTSTRTWRATSCIRVWVVDATLKAAA